MRQDIHVAAVAVDTRPGDIRPRGTDGVESHVAADARTTHVGKQP